MKPDRLVFSALLVAAAATTLSCGERTATGPAPGPGSLQASTLSTTSTIASCLGLTSGTVKQAIGPAGGVITVGPYTLTIPPQALSTTVTIQAKIPFGSIVNIIQFKPDGLVFQQPASLTMGYSHCRLLTGMHPQVVQISDLLAIIEYLPSTSNTAARTVTGVLRHFSNYAVAF